MTSCGVAVRVLSVLPQGHRERGGELGVILLVDRQRWSALLRALLAHRERQGLL